jgi:hypothetical protein
VTLHHDDELLPDSRELMGPAGGGLPERLRAEAKQPRAQTAAAAAAAAAKEAAAEDGWAKWRAFKAGAPANETSASRAPAAWARRPPSGPSPATRNPQPPHPPPGTLPEDEMAYYRSLQEADAQRRVPEWLLPGNAREMASLKKNVRARGGGADWGWGVGVGRVGKR